MTDLFAHSIMKIKDPRSRKHIPNMGMRWLNTSVVMLKQPINRAPCFTFAHALSCAGNLSNKKVINKRSVTMSSYIMTIHLFGMTTFKSTMTIQVSL